MKKLSPGIKPNNVFAVILYGLKPVPFRLIGWRNGRRFDEYIYQMYLLDMFNLNTTSYAILGGLSIQPDISGYDMRKGIQNSIGYFWGESYGQIYPALKRLSADGLIAPSKAKSPSKARAKGRDRQTYVITDAGRAALRQWLALPFHNEPPRNEFLLKLFFCREAAPGVAAAHVRDVNERNRRMLDLLTKIEASVPAEQEANPHLPYWMLTLGLGKALTCAALEWGEKALTALSAWEKSAAAVISPRNAARVRPPATPIQLKSRQTKKTAVTSQEQHNGKRGSTRSERKVSK
jgi:DNA-binding PadR family transcriptional regulator